LQAGAESGDQAGAAVSGRHDAGTDELASAGGGGAEAVPAASELPAGLVRLMAVTCAVTVANLYYAQPPLPAIARSLQASQGSASPARSPWSAAL
jgi:hypothetical protein